MKKENKTNKSYYTNHWEQYQGQDVPSSKINAAGHFLDPVIQKFPKRKIHILDAGCGDGVHWRYLRSLPTQQFLFEGIDIAPSVINHLTNHSVHAEDHFQIMDLENLDFPDNHFDVVYAFGVIGYCENPQKCFRELCRVCKQGGFLGIYSPNISGMKRFLFNSLRACCRLLGMKTTRSIARILIPFYGMLPSTSKMTQRNSSEDQIEEVIMTNIAPPHLEFLSHDLLVSWFETEGFNIFYDDPQEMNIIWGEKL